MIYRNTHKGVVWIDLDRPTEAEVDQIIKEFDIDPIVANELSSPAKRPRVELHNNFIYLVLHFPAFRHRHVEKVDDEIDFIISKDFLITSRFNTIDAVHQFEKKLEVEEILNHKKKLEYPPGFLFYLLLKHLYYGVFDQITTIESWLAEIELNIFKGNERDMVFTISEVSSTLLDFRKTTDMHREVLISLDIFGKKVFGEHFSHYTRTALEEYYKVQNNLKNFMDVVTELRETNNSLLNARQNEVTKTLTILAFIVAPLSLLVSIFQIKASNEPILLGTEYDFFILIAILLGIGAGMFGYFRYKGWL